MSAGTVARSVHLPCLINSSFPPVVAAGSLAPGGKGEASERRKTVQIIMAGLFFVNSFFFILPRAREGARQEGSHVGQGAGAVWGAAWSLPCQPLSALLCCYDCDFVLFHGLARTSGITWLWESLGFVSKQSFICLLEWGGLFGGYHFFFF